MPATKDRAFLFAPLGLVASAVALGVLLEISALVVLGAGAGTGYSLSGSV
jgi:hypothetical protein